jgi:hypothetical protein
MSFQFFFSKFCINQASRLILNAYNQPNDTAFMAETIYLMSGDVSSLTAFIKTIILVYFTKLTHPSGYTEDFSP